MLQMTKYQQLCNDLYEIYSLAEDSEFHDYSNTKFATPKVELVRRLQMIINKVKEGKYDQDDIR